MSYVLMSVMIAIAAVPQTARATAPTDAAQTQGEAKDPYQQQLEDTYKQEVQTNSLKEWPQGPGIYGDAGIVMDAETGAILYGKNIDQKEYPASITKLLTALLAFEYCDMTEDVVITAESLTCLGDGYASASEMKYCGARYIFNQKIDITQIEQIEIIKYKISR